MNKTKILEFIYKFRFLKWILKLLLFYKNREKTFHYGKENPHQIFYIIGEEDKTGGLWWIINKSLMHIAYAVDCGYIAVIDLQNHKTQYSKEDILNKENVWEYYFEQPMGYNLFDIIKSRNIIISKKGASPNRKYLMGQNEFYDDIKRIAYFRDLFNKYIIFNQKTQDYLLYKYDTILKGKGKVLGVLCRGTDYVVHKPTGHPVQPDPKVVIDNAKQVMLEYNCSALYLATEDVDIFNLFKSHFKDKLLSNNQKRFSKTELTCNKWISSVISEEALKDNNLYLTGLEYLSSIYLLTKCNCFIGGRTGGTKGVLLMSNGFEYQYIYNLGNY